MRPARVVAFVAALFAVSLAAEPRGAADDPPQSAPPPEKKLPPLRVTVDKAKVDLEKHTLEVRMSREASLVKIEVFDGNESMLASEEHDFHGQPANTPLVVTWAPSGSEPVGRIDVWGHDAFGYYAGVRIVPWSLSIPHEDVNFATGKADIAESEQPKLEASLQAIREAFAKHEKLGTITLFVAGHTDTVSSSQYNLQLSLKRARAIAKWFRTHGLKIPVSYHGFGESSLLVQTDDEVDEPRNRRADYVLAIDPPRFKNGGTPAWKSL